MFCSCFAVICSVLDILLVINSTNKLKDTMGKIIIYTFYNHGIWNDRKQMLMCCHEALQLVSLLKKQNKKLAFYKEVPIGGNLIALKTYLMRRSDNIYIKKEEELDYILNQ